MRRVHGLLVLLVLGCVSTVESRGGAQELQLADRGPRFLSAPSTPGGAVDVSRAPVFQRRVTLELVDVPLGAALAAMGRQVGLEFLASRQLVPLDKPVTLSATQITLGAALYELLTGMGLDVQLSPTGRSAAIVSRSGTGVVTTASQQGRGTIAGRVVDAVRKSPLDQVAVRVEGLGLGTTTTSDGRYTVRSVPPGTYRVTARRVGYTPLTKTVSVAVDSLTDADFALTAAAAKLNEVVTTAIGEQRRYEVGNVISTINADSITPTAPITSLTDLISARAPGVTVQETGGLTGAGEAIRIRGQSSPVLQGDPIIIVDGVRQDNAPGGTAALPLAASFGAVGTPSPSRLNDLDFSTIESIDVLKGPAASTEYGTDAANGVIVITTKHGSAGGPQWQASAEGTRSEIPESFPTKYYSWGHTTAGSHAAVQCPLVPYVYGSGYGSATGTCAVDSVTTWDPLNSSRYSIFGTGNRQKYDLSVSGGSDAMRYFVASGLSNENGVLQMPQAFVAQANAFGLPHSTFHPNSENQRSVRTNSAIRLGPAVDLTVSGAYLSTYQAAPNAQHLYNALASSPALRDSAQGYGYGSLSYNSPVYQFGKLTSQTADRVTGGVTASWRPGPWLVGHVTVGIDHGSERNQSAVLPQIASLYPYAPTGQLGVENVTTDIYTADLRGSATATVTRTVRAVTSVGLQLSDARLQGTTVMATGISATNFTLNGVTSPTVAQLGNRQATVGGYGEEQLGMSDRLFLTAALRLDAGSGFGRAYSTAAYPKVSVSWLAATSGATTVRLRGAFGESGVQPPNGAALQLYAPTTAWYNGGQASSVAIANVQNQLLRPERSAEFEGGIDVGLWQNRVSMDFTVYSKTTHDALVSTGTGWEAGQFPYTENVGTVRNTGLEGAMSATLARARVATWDVTLNASVNHNNLLALAPGVLSQQFTGSFALYRFAAGYPLYGYWAPQARYADLNHDGVLEPSELTVADSLTYAGASLPTREVSLGTHVGLWGGALSVGALVDYRGGFRLMNSVALAEVFAPQSDPASNQRTAPLWEQARDLAAETINATGLDAYASAAGFYEDATYLRFRELSVTYILPRGLVRALRLQRASLTGAVRNLALWTRYTGVDPEVSNSLGTNVQLSPTSNTYQVNNDMREDFGAVPLLRHWVIRLNIGL